MSIGFQAQATNLDTIPFDVLQIITTYLEPREVAYLALNRELWLKVNAFVVWQPFLERLREIDKQTVDELALLDSTPVRFKSEFLQISTRQFQEIEHFKALIGTVHATFPEEMSEALMAMVRPSTSLQVLEQRNQFLNELNTHIVRSNIDLNVNYLHLSGRKITRFPVDLFLDPSLNDYWSSLKTLTCTHNKLRFLPDLIGHCTALTHFNCEMNQLRKLPETLGNCQALEEFNCGHNKLQKLPDGLINWLALRVLICEHNQIEFLPHQLGNLVKLEELFCTYNRLRVIPASIASCKSLKVLYCDDNQLNNLPRAIWRKFGSTECNRTLYNQTEPDLNFPTPAAYIPSRLDLNSRPDSHTQSQTDSQLHEPLNEIAPTDSSWPTHCIMM